jgi:chromosome transmission fidelity protein 4
MSDNSIAMELPHRGKCIKSVSFDPKGEFLSACDDAGVLTVWALKTITKKDGGDDDDDDENAEDDTHKSSIEPGDSVMSATVAPVT